MANAAKLQEFLPVRMLVLGYPKGGKTGSLAALANAGFKLRVLDYDGNTEPLILHTKPDKLANIDIVTLEDKLRTGSSQFIEASGIPTAFRKGWDLLDHWKYTEADGTEVDLGLTSEWGPDTILILDSMSDQGRAAERRAMKIMNKTPLNNSIRVRGLGMAEQEAFIEKMTAKGNKFHVIALAHLKMIGPKDFEKDDGDLTKALKERTAAVVETKLFPRALGRELPPVIGGHFPTIVLVEPKYKGSHVTRVIRTMSKPELDLGVPGIDVPAELPIETGMLTLFEKLSPGSVKLVQKGMINDTAK